MATHRSWQNRARVTVFNNKRSLRYLFIELAYALWSCLYLVPDVPFAPDNGFLLGPLDFITWYVLQGPDNAKWFCHACHLVRYTMAKKVCQELFSKKYIILRDLHFNFPTGAAYKLHTASFSATDSSKLTSSMELYCLSRKSLWPSYRALSISRPHTKLTSFSVNFGIWYTGQKLSLGVGWMCSFQTQRCLPGTVLPLLLL